MEILACKGKAPSHWRCGGGARTRLCGGNPVGAALKRRDQWNSK
jgi:hypothetical protein